MKDDIWGGHNVLYLNIRETSTVQLLTSEHNICYQLNYEIFHQK